ncbi:MAG: hypothetical protein DRN66_04215 [Candidatus Nanohalarchaeota archaeon]|nr:MAG: hypothetical protein DRN66_04215 [Candidatus Nanohaloarchaeota archaeon]
MERKIEKNYDLAIIGSGCSGLTSGLYAGRYKLNTIIIGSFFGGVIVEAHDIENYPGFVSINGMELMKKFRESVDLLNIPILSKEIVSVKKCKDRFCITMDDKKQIYANAVIVACGTKKRKLSIEGEKKFSGKGVSYCATCDAPIFANKNVAIIGGADSACQAALLLSEHAKQVYQIYRGPKLGGEPINIDHVLKNKKIEVIYNTNAIKFNGTNLLESIELDREYNGSKKLDVEGVFIEIGAVPSIYFLDDLDLKLTEKKEIKVDKYCNTNIEGLYAAGDVTDTPLRQLVTACGQGAIAALSAYKYILKNKHSGA